MSQTAEVPTGYGTVPPYVFNFAKKQGLKQVDLPKQIKPPADAKGMMAFDDGGDYIYTISAKTNGQYGIDKWNKNYDNTWSRGGPEDGDTAPTLEEMADVVMSSGESDTTTDEDYAA